MEENEAKEKILKGAEMLFMRYGIRSISMDDIARHLTVSKKTLYQHFTDKDDMITQISKIHLERNIEEMEMCSNTSENAIDELGKISICLKKDMEEMNPSLLFDMQKYHPKAWAVWIEFKNRFIRESVEKNLYKGIEEGHFRPEINVEVLAALRMQIVEDVFDEKLFPKDKFNLAETQMQIFDHFVYGLCTEKGRKLYQKYKAETITVKTTQ
ncbi:MAG TPA: TetR/AcrR family transcriptional regulator [Cyclobacteriaceae bacterium]|jgi:AcrR family transcriptional regulator|nr:TetR/AcrR family transcriptional regulator [Cyclobacteriaceae bacterium]